MLHGLLFTVIWGFYSHISASATQKSSPSAPAIANQYQSLRGLCGCVLSGVCSCTLALLPHLLEGGLVPAAEQLSEGCVITQRICKCNFEADTPCSALVYRETLDIPKNQRSGYCVPRRDELLGPAWSLVDQSHPVSAIAPCWAMQGLWQPLHHPCCLAGALVLGLGPVVGVNHTHVLFSWGNSYTGKGCCVYHKNKYNK